jgi:hypothetical protein
MHQEEALTRHKICRCLILDFQPPNCEEYISDVYKLPGLWYFIIAAQAGQVGGLQLSFPAPN